MVRSRRNKPSNGRTVLVRLTPFFDAAVDFLICAMSKVQVQRASILGRNLPWQWQPFLVADRINWADAPTWHVLHVHRATTASLPLGPLWPPSPIYVSRSHSHIRKCRLESEDRRYESMQCGRRVTRPARLPAKTKRLPTIFCWRTTVAAGDRCVIKPQPLGCLWPRMRVHAIRHMK